MSVNSKMTAIADPIRTLMGSEGKMGLDAMAENLDEAVAKVDTQAELIQQIKTALEGKAAGTVPSGTLEIVENGTYDVTNYASANVEVEQGVQLPELDNPGSASDLAEGMELIDADGNVVTGTVPVKTGITFPLDGTEPTFGVVGSSSDGSCLVYVNGQEKEFLYRPSGMLAGMVIVQLPQTELYQFGDATEADVVAGKTFTSSAGVKKEGTASLGITPSGTKQITTNGTHDVTNYASAQVNVPEGNVIKTGTTTDHTIATGLSSIEEFFIYKTSVSATGLINLRYSKSSGTSYVYASAWSTNTWGSKTITSGTTAATISGGSITLPSSTATSGGLSSGVTYNWVAIGKE